MKIEYACKVAGFETCDFGLDDDSCEKCGAPNRQLYYRRTCHFNEEGEYFCEHCVIRVALEIEVERFFDRCVDALKMANADISQWMMLAEFQRHRIDQRLAWCPKQTALAVSRDVTRRCRDLLTDLNNFKTQTAGEVKDENATL